MSAPEVEAPMNALSPAELRRYARHLILPEVGDEGQRKLKAARVLMVGAGGLGSPVGLYLAAAGVGTLGVVEFDRVDESNLQRQVLYGASDLGRPKLEAAAERLGEVNPHVQIEAHDTRLDGSNALELVSAYDLVVDGSDNFATRYLVNDACVLAGRPNVYGSIFRFEGQVSVFATPGGPCYRCLFPEPPPPGAVPSCAEGGVLGVLPGIIGSLQANEAIKLALGRGTPLVGRLLLFDAMGAGFREVRIPKAADCPVCSDHPTQTGLVDYGEVCEPEPAVAAPRERAEIDVQTLARWQSEGRELTLLDVRNPPERALCRIEGSRFVPLPELAHRTDELDPGATLVVYCHSGIRSGQAVAFLRGSGFARALNLIGGIDAWSVEIDPSVPRY